KLRRRCSKQWKNGKLLSTAKHTRCHRYSRCSRLRIRSNTKARSHYPKRSSIVSSSRYCWATRLKPTSEKYWRDGTMALIQSDWTRSTSGHSPIQTRSLSVVRKLRERAWNRACSITPWISCDAHARIRSFTTAQVHVHQSRCCCVPKPSRRFAVATL